MMSDKRPLRTPLCLFPDNGQLIRIGFTFAYQLFFQIWKAAMILFGYVVWVHVQKSGCRQVRSWHGSWHPAQFMQVLSRAGGKGRQVSRVIAWCVQGMDKKRDWWRVDDIARHPDLCLKSLLHDHCYSVRVCLSPHVCYCQGDDISARFLESTCDYHTGGIPLDTIGIVKVP